VLAYIDVPSATTPPRMGPVPAIALHEPTVPSALRQSASDPATTYAPLDHQHVLPRARP
jgi:hypothetical protein